ncbi:hypothetical protein LIT33_31245 (plasmid) [Priestia megaterium]|nr:hypothetical protein LIT33_31245 [Priestia megaterium]
MSLNINGFNTDSVYPDEVRRYLFLRVY